MRKVGIFLLAALLAFIVTACARQEELVEVGAEEEQESVPVVDETLTKQRDFSTDWNQYQLSCEGNIYPYKNRMYYSAYYCQAEIPWILDLSLEEALTTKEAEEQLGGKAVPVEIGPYSGWRKHYEYILENDRFQFYFVAYSDQNLYSSLEDFASMIKNTYIEQGDFSVEFSLTEDKLKETLRSLMMKYDAMLDYSTINFSEIPLDGLKTVTLVDEVLHYDSDGNPYVKDDEVLYAEATKEVFGEDFPWQSTEDIEDVILDIFVDLEAGWQLSSDLLEKEPPAFRDIDGKLYFYSGFLGGMHFEKQDELIDYESVELLEEEDGIIYFHVEKKNGEGVLWKLTQNEAGEWLLADNFS